MEAHDGAQRLTAPLDSDAMQAIKAALGHLPFDRAGIRLFGIAGMRALLSSTSPMGSIAASALGHEARPVREILFDKSHTNAQIDFALEAFGRIGKELGVI